MWYQLVDAEEEEMRQALAALGLDTSTPNVARIYDFLLITDEGVGPETS